MHHGRELGYAGPQVGAGGPVVVQSNPNLLHGGRAEADSLDQLLVHEISSALLAMASSSARAGHSRPQADSQPEHLLSRRADSLSLLLQLHTGCVGWRC